MVTKIAVTLLLVQVTLKCEETEDSVDVLAELPLQELLLQKKNLEKNLMSEETPMAPVAMPLTMVRPVFRDHRGRLRKRPIVVRKTFHDDDDSEDEKGHMHEKKEKHKSHDILNTSLTALSYLAFGGYLIAIIVNSLREKRRRVMMAYPTATGTGTNPTSNVFHQHFVNRRPIRVRFPAVAVQNGKKRRKRRYENPYNEEDRYGKGESSASSEEIDDFAVLNLDN